MTKDKVIQELKNVIDPELGVSVWDLGLIYDININGSKANVLVTLTSMACPLANHILADIESAVATAGFKKQDIDVELTFDPPWNEAMMSDEARQVLGIF